MGLCITRKEGQSVIIDNRIKVTYLRRPGKGHEIRLLLTQIDGNAEQIPFHREEIWLKIREADGKANKQTNS